MLYDITPPITDSLKAWPGDTPPSRELMSELADGASVTLSTLRTTVHIGAHADAPSHYGLNAPSIDEVSLESYLGPCRVVRVDVPRGSRVSVDDWLTAAKVSQSARAPRVLFATGTFPDPSIFNEDFAALAPDLIDHLNGDGVRLVGIDTPSIDLFSSKDLPAHHRCLRHDFAILEGLVLSRVPAGLYELIALPLKLVGFDGSPVRAVLRAVTSN